MSALARRRGLQPITLAATNLFFPSETGLTPGANNVDSAVTLGVLIQAVLAGKSIKGIRYFATTAGNGQSATANLYDGSGTLLAAGGTQTLVGNAWNTFLFGSPITSVVGNDYLPAIFLPSANYPASTLGNPINANFKVPAGNGGRYAYGGTAQALSSASNGANSWYGMDLVYS